MISYTQLNALITKYGGSGSCSLNVIAFPCNQFANQEPSSNAEILNVLKYVRPGNGFQPKMDMFSKANVNGASEIEIFSWLKSVCPSPVDVLSSSNTVLWSPIRKTDIEWNFEKFLINHNGEPIKRYSADTPPLTMEEDIYTLIEQCKKDTYYEEILTNYN